MRYIKHFEQKHKKSKNKFWMVRTDTPYYEISLDKIGMTEDEKKEYNKQDLNFDRMNYIYIGLNFDDYFPESIYYYDVDKNEFDDEGYKYLGRIENKITQKDIEKWQLENDAKKYNL